MKLKLKILCVLVSLSFIGGCIEAGKSGKSKFKRTKPADSGGETQQEEQKDFSLKGTVSFLVDLVFPSAHALVSECKSRCSRNDRSCIKLFMVQENEQLLEICEANIDHRGEYDMRFHSPPSFLDGEVIQYQAVTGRGDLRKLTSVYDKRTNQEAKKVNPQSTSEAVNLKKNLIKKKIALKKEGKSFLRMQLNAMKDLMNEAKKEVVQGQGVPAQVAPLPQLKKPEEVAQQRPVAKPAPTPRPKRSCGSFKHGEKEAVVRYLKSRATEEEGCKSQVRVRTCTDGVFSSFSGSFSQPACDVIKKVVKKDCRVEGNKLVKHGQIDTRVMYHVTKAFSAVDCGAEVQKRSCNDGNIGPFSGAAKFATCDVVPRPVFKKCNYENKVIAHKAAASRVRFEKAKVLAPATCQKQTQISFCNDGKLDGKWTGSFTQTDCIVEQPRLHDVELFVDRSYFDPDKRNDKWLNITEGLKETIDLGTVSWGDLNLLKLPIKIVNHSSGSVRFDSLRTPKGFTLEELGASLAANQEKIFYIALASDNEGKKQGSFSFRVNGKEYSINLSGEVR